MKFLKSLGLLVIAAAALMAFASVASAEEATSSTGNKYEAGIKASAEGHAVLDNRIATIECASSVEGKIESFGPGKPVSGNINSLSFTGCTDSWHVTVVAPGSLSVESPGTGYNGDVYSNGATVEATRFGVTCRYITSNTTVGLMTGGSPATMHINAGIPLHSGSIFCGEGPTTWTGSYKVNTPTSLYIDNT